MEKNEYKLTISIGSGFKGGSITDTEQESDVDKLAKTMTPLLTAYNMAQPFINSSKQIVENQVETKYGSRELSSRINLVMNLGQFTARTSASIFSGASIASALGLSAGMGGIIGAVITAGSKIANIMTNYDEISNKAFIENEQINILRGRTGVQFNRSRSGE